MKTINSLRSKLFALTLALMASVSSFAYEFEYVNDFHIDGFGYKIISINTPDNGEGYVSLIEIADCKKDVVIPKYVSYGDRGFHVTTFGIGSVVFTNDASSVVESITIPKTIDIINKNALAGCSNLKTVVVDSENPYYDSRENCNAIITTSQNPYITPNTLIAGCKTTIIPNSVVEIGENAFYDCESLETITIPNSVTKIGKSTFNACSTLSSITLSENLTAISDWAFDDCNSLKEVICYAPQPPTISKYTFSDISPTIYVPENTVTIYQNAPYWMTFDIQPIQPSYKSQWCDTWNVLDLKYRTIKYTTKEDFETWRYYLAQDTIINNYTYTAVTRQTTKVPEGVYPFTIPEPEYVAAVRFTNDRKVYIYYDNTEYLLYDFNVQPGDELTVFAGINHYHSHHTNTIRVDEVERYPGIYPFGTEISLSVFPDFYGDERPACFGVTKWVEGVGDLCGFITGADCGLSEYQTALLCAYKDGNTEYTTEYEEYAEYGCEYNSGENKEYILTLPGLQRTVCNEYCGETEEDNSANFTYKQTFDSIFFENDKPYILCNGYLLREEDNKIFLYSQSLNKDIVLYDFTLEVGDSLPAYIKDFDGTMYSDDTLVVTGISSVTLLDGKEYKNWTFDNGMEYVEGIGMYGGHRNGNFFGLIQEIVVPCHTGTHLVCVSKNGQLLYKMDDTEMERLGAECLCEIEPKWSETWCNQWNILSHGYLGPQDPLAGARTSIYWLSNNTVNRNGQEYIPLMCSSSLPNEESTLLVGELRFTEDKQVYFYYAFDETEYLLYDFGAELGDTLELFAGLEFYNYHKTYTHVITDKETLDDGRLQIQADVVIRIDNGAGEYFEEKHPVTWIEGLGSTYGIIFNPSNPGVAGDGAIIMLCAYRDDECVYTTNFSDYKNMGCVYNNDGTVDEDLFPMLAGLQRTICNEFCGDTEDDNSSNTTYKQTFDKILFERDQPYIYCNSAFLLREENNKILIYSHSLDKDLVLYDFTLEVGDSLPQLYFDEEAKKDIYWIYYEYMNVVDYNKYNDSIYPADTLIVTDVSMITLLDGKEYKKWTFNNGMEYVEGIGSFGNGQWSGDFFQLIANKDVPTCLLDEHLVCASKNGQLLYKMDDAEMERLGAECLCDYNNGPKKDNAKNGKIGGRPTPTQWNMLEVETKEMDGTPTILRAETFSYTLENDSIIANNKTFYQLARQSTKDTAITKSFVGALHFGEDEDNRVYFLRDGVEYVLYDFTAEPGDTIEIFAGINNYPQYTTYTHVVTGKDTLENGACRMMLEVVFPDETSSVENAQKVWLAGLGSIDGIVHNAAQRTSDAHAAPSRSASSETQTSVMLCAWREDSCLYTTNHPEYDTFGCVYNQDPTAIENLTSPSSYQKIIHEGTLLILHEGKVYNVIGIQIK